MLTLSIIIPVLAAAGVDSTMMLGLVVVGILFLTALTGIGGKPKKKKYCPFCGRQIEFLPLPKGAKLICPYCGEAADTNPKD
jgi:hypothetical protein